MLIRIRSIIELISSPTSCETFSYQACFPTQFSFFLSALIPTNMRMRTPPVRV